MLLVIRTTSTSMSHRYLRKQKAANERGCWGLSFAGSAAGRWAKAAARAVAIVCTHQREEGGK